MNAPDEVRITIKRQEISDPTFSEESRTYDYFFTTDVGRDFRGDADSITDALIQILNEDDSKWLHDGFEIIEQRKITEWGGSGAIWQIVMELGSHVPAGVIGYLVAQVIERWKAQWATGKSSALIDHDEALRSARWKLVTQFPKQAELSEVEPYEVEHDESTGSWAFRFATDNRSYECTVMPALDGRAMSSLKVVTKTTFQ